jgi:voltage-gated sodium channel
MTINQFAGLPRSARIEAIVEHPKFLNFVTGVVIFNAFLLGVLTYRDHLAGALVSVLDVLDSVITYFFAFEIAAKWYALRSRFWKSGWNVFEFLVVAVSLLPGASSFSVLRAMRVLRLFRLLHVVPVMKRITEALIRCLPGMGAIGAVLALFIYVASVMATVMFGHSGNPDVQRAFGDLPSSAFSLFQVMTGDGWSDVVRMVTADGQPFAWLFFLAFIFIASFVVLNLFIALVVDSLADEQKEIIEEKLHDLEADMEEKVEQELGQLEEKIEGKVEEEMEELGDEIESLEKIDLKILEMLKEMRVEMAELRAALNAQKSGP